MIQLMKYPRIIREKKKLSDIALSGGCTKETLEDPNCSPSFAHQIRTSPSYVKTAKSILENGWIPDYRHVSYNDEDRQKFHPFTCSHSDNISSSNPILVGGLHRYLVLHDLKYSEIDTFVRYDKFFLETPDSKIKNIISILESKKHDQEYIFQKFDIPNFKFDFGRDDLTKIFDHSRIRYEPWSFFSGKTVLDIATNIGFWAILAKWLGADRVDAFDRNQNLINIAKEMAEIHQVDINFSSKAFWEYHFEQYDVVMANQSIYHFNNIENNANYDNKKTKYDVLDIICDATKETLMMYTFIYRGGAKDCNEREPHRYLPTESEVREDLSSRGFKDIKIYDDYANPHFAHKKWVIAHRVKDLY